MPTCNLFGNYNWGLDIISIIYKLASEEGFWYIRMQRTGLLLNIYASFVGYFN